MSALRAGALVYPSHDPSTSAGNWRQWALKKPAERMRPFHTEFPDSTMCTSSVQLLKSVHCFIVYLANVFYFSFFPGKYYVLVLWYQKNTVTAFHPRFIQKRVNDTPGTRDPIMAITTGQALRPSNSWRLELASGP